MEGIYVKMILNYIIIVNNWKKKECTFLTYRLVPSTLLHDSLVIVLLLHRLFWIFEILMLAQELQNLPNNNELGKSG